MLILASSIFLPYLFKDKIIEAIRTEANKSLKPTLDFDKNLSINIFKSFPNLHLGLRNLSLVYPEGTFENDTFFYTDKLEVSFDLMKFYKEQLYIIRSFELNDPRIHLEFQSDSLTNWDILTDTSSSEDDNTINFELANVSITNGVFDYHDVEANSITRLKNVNHTSSGNFNTQKFTLDAVSKIGEVEVSYDDIVYVNKWNVTQKGNFEIDLENGLYGFPNNALTINGLALDLDGSVKIEEEDMIFDLGIHSTSSDVNAMLTLIPAIYQSDFKSIQTKGSSIFDFTFKGKYNNTSFPAYNLKLGIENGWFKYPDFNLPAEDLFVNLNIYSTDGNVDRTVIDIPKLHFKIANDPFDLKLKMNSIFNNPLIDLKALGQINLGNFKELLALDNSTLTGKIYTDLEIKGRANSISNSEIDKFYAKGDFETTNLRYQTPDMSRLLEVEQAQLKFKNQQVELPIFKGSLGKNEITLSGAFDNFFAYVLNDKTLQGDLKLYSPRLNTNTFLTEESSQDSISMTLIEIPGNVNLALNAQVDNLIYDDLELTNFKGEMSVLNKALILKNVSTDILGGRLALEGDYQYDEVNPRAKFDLTYSNISIANLFSKFKVVKAFAPIAKEIKAMTTAKLSFASDLNQDMSPKLSNLNLGGSLNLENIKVGNLEVLKGLDSKLGTNHFQVKELRDFLLNFKIADGKLLVNPFDLFIDSSKLSLQGVSKLDGSLDYSGFLSIPASYLKNETSRINSLTKNTPFKDYELNMKDYLKLALSIGGTFKKPTLNLNLKEVKKNVKENISNIVTNEVAKKKAEVEKLAQQELNKIKEETSQKVKDAESKLKEELAKKQKETEERLRLEAAEKKKKLEEEAKNKLKNLLKKP